VADIANLFHLKQRKSQMGQAQILAAALFLLLIPTTMIVAQNATDNITGGMTANITSTSPENITENTTLPAKENNTPVFFNESETGEGAPINETNLTLPEENITINITLLLDETNVTLPNNQTLPEPTNQTSGQNQTQEQPGQEQQEPEATGPVIETSPHMPGRANRNEPFLLSAEISNRGDTDAHDVEIEWVLPDGISILAGSGSHYCDVPAGATCTSELTVAASLSSKLGEREIKLLVRYFE